MNRIVFSFYRFCSEKMGRHTIQSMDLPKPAKAKAIADWFNVRLDDEGIHLEVEPREPGIMACFLPWRSVTRVCFRAEDFLISDGLYLFTNMRPESYAVPVEAAGGDALLNDLIARKLFPAELAIKAASAMEGELFLLASLRALKFKRTPFYPQNMSEGLSSYLS
jgi:hypothetical protein